uniref:Putative secreted protein n=1 Tax=Ixodes ricinus TaxID=34613 RepID=A0A6B0UCD5_IXORI
MMVVGLPVMIITFGTLEVKSMSEAYVCLRTEGFQGASPFFSLRCFKKTAAPYEGFWPRFASLLWPQVACWFPNYSHQCFWVCTSSAHAWHKSY